MTVFTDGTGGTGVYTYAALIAFVGVYFGQILFRLDGLLSLIVHDEIAEVGQRLGGRWDVVELRCVDFFQCAILEPADYVGTERAGYGEVFGIWTACGYGGGWC